MNISEIGSPNRPTRIVPKCAIHGLALAPDQLCVLCRRKPTVAAAPRPWTTWIFQGLFFSIVMATAALYCIQ